MTLLFLLNHKDDVLIIINFDADIEVFEVTSFIFLGFFFDLVFIFLIWFKQID